MYGTSSLAGRFLSPLCGCLLAVQVLVAGAWDASGKLASYVEYDLSYDFWGLPSYGWGSFSNAVSGQVLVNDVPYSWRSNEYRAYLISKGWLTNSALQIVFTAVFKGTNAADFYDGFFLPGQSGLTTTWVAWHLQRDQFQWCDINVANATPVASAAGDALFMGCDVTDFSDSSPVFYESSGSGSLATGDLRLWVSVFVSKESHWVDLRSFWLCYQRQFVVLTNQSSVFNCRGSNFIIWQTNFVGYRYETNYLYSRPGDIAVDVYRVDGTNSDQRHILGGELGRLESDGTIRDIEIATGLPDVESRPAIGANGQLGQNRRMFFRSSPSWRVNHLPFNPPPPG